MCVLGGEIYDKIYTIFCTGFRPILDAMKSFAKDENPIDIEVCFQYRHINFRTANVLNYVVYLIVKLANHEENKRNSPYLINVCNLNSDLS